MKVPRAKCQHFAKVGERALAAMKRADWKVVILSDSKNLGSAIAETTPSIWDKTLIVALSKGLFKFDSHYQDETIVHEVIHGMLAASQAQADYVLKKTKGVPERVRADVLYIFEEEFVNSLTNAVAAVVLK